ncbi:MAG: TolC family protein [Candidatus Caenarcaniphilales bacterium]|nr:TolC family protein [Candidatus Caenarcaniphilales bacterium]
MRLIAFATILVFFFAQFALARDEIKYMDYIALSLEEKVQEIDLATIANLVQRQNIELAISKNQIKQAEATMYGSIAGFLPSISFSNSIESFKGGEIIFGAEPVELDRRTFRPTISLDYQIQTGGKPIFQLMSNVRRLKRARSAKSTALQGALLDASAEYFSWLKDINSLTAAETSLQEAETQLSLSESRANNGFATQLEVMQSKTKLAEAQNIKIRVQNQAKISETNLASTLNIPLTTELKPWSKELKPLTLYDENLSIAECMQSAVENRPDIKETFYQIEEARSNLGVAVSELFPVINLNAYFRGIGPQPDDLRETRRTFIEARTDLLRNMGVGTIANIKLSKERVKEAMLRKQAQLNEVQKTLAKAYYDYKLYGDQLKSTSTKLESAEEAYRIAINRLQNGLGQNIDVIQAQTELSLTRLEYQTTVMNYNIAQISLLYETGRLKPDVLASVIE